MDGSESGRVSVADDSFKKSGCCGEDADMLASSKLSDTGMDYVGDG
jgi:hypothetical protein